MVNLLEFSKALDRINHNPLLLTPYYILLASSKTLYLYLNTKRFIFNIVFQYLDHKRRNHADPYWVHFYFLYMHLNILSILSFRIHLYTVGILGVNWHVEIEIIMHTNVHYELVFQSTNIKPRKYFFKCLV